MKKLIIFILFYLLSNIAMAGDPNINVSKISKPYHYTEGGIKISLGVIRFNAHDWRRHNISREVRKAPKMNYAWNDKWYYADLPDSKNQVLVLFWKNLDRHTQGWVAIKNTPTAWHYRSDKKGWRQIGDGKKVVTHWSEFGDKDTGNKSTGSLSIDIKNYKNRGSRGENVIRVSFGY